MREKWIKIRNRKHHENVRRKLGNNNNHNKNTNKEKKENLKILKTDPSVTKTKKNTRSYSSNRNFYFQSF
jgi:hypothetical protein